jgi:hypothetical protein
VPAEARETLASDDLRSSGRALPTRLLRQGEQQSAEPAPGLSQVVQLSSLGGLHRHARIHDKGLVSGRSTSASHRTPAPDPYSARPAARLTPPRLLRHRLLRQAEIGEGAHGLVSEVTELVCLGEVRLLKPIEDLEYTEHAVFEQ